MKRQIIVLPLTLVFLFFLFTYSSANNPKTQKGELVSLTLDNFSGESKTIYMIERTNGQLSSLFDGRIITNENGQENNIPPVLGQKTLAIILTNFTDDRSTPINQAQVQEIAFGSNPFSLSSLVAANSYNRVTLSGQVFDWVTIEPPKDPQGIPYTGCNKSLQAIQAAQNAAGAKKFDYYMIIVPSSSALGCNFAGFGGGTISAIYSNFVGDRVMLHEVGHMFGLEHAAYIDYPTNPAIDVAACPIGDCEYADQSDNMGSGPDTFHAFSRVKLGWIDNADVTTVNFLNPDQTIVLTSLEQPSGTRDVTIPFGNSEDYSYHVEYRCCDRVLEGVSIRLDKPRSFFESHSFLVPGGMGDHRNPLQAALTQPGQTFKDSLNNITVSIVAMEERTATVRVTVPQIPPPHIDKVSYNGAKKLVIKGDNFGQDAHLLINGIDISDRVTWQNRSDSNLKLKAKAAIYGFKQGQNTIQVKITMDSGTFSSNAFLLNL